jgi:hypothetical protein
MTDTTFCVMAPSQIPMSASRKLPRRRNATCFGGIGLERYPIGALAWGRRWPRESTMRAVEAPEEVRDRHRQAPSLPQWAECPPLDCNAIVIRTIWTQMLPLASRQRPGVRSSPSPRSRLAACTSRRGNCRRSRLRRRGRMVRRFVARSPQNRYCRLDSSIWEEPFPWGRLSTVRSSRGRRADGFSAIATTRGAPKLTFRPRIADCFVWRDARV